MTAVIRTSVFYPHIRS